MTALRTIYFMLILAIAAISFSTVVLAESSNDPVYFYASQSGGKTLDQGEGGGNPFASALIDLLTYDKLTLETFQDKLISLTEMKSRGFQRPEIKSNIGINKWQISPQSIAEKRVALVIIFSDYSVSGITSLPGAMNDSKRISEALSDANFDVQTIVDPDHSELDNSLEEFMSRSKESDIAAIYTTGHGVEVKGTIYLLPGDYPINYGDTKLDSHAIQLSHLGNAVHAKKLNLVFYAGCRNNPF